MNSKTLRRLRAVEEKPQEVKPSMAVERNSKFVWTRGADVMKNFFLPPLTVLLLEVFLLLLSVV